MVHQSQLSNLSTKKSFSNLINDSCDTDYRHWSSDPRVVREAFYENSQQNKMEYSNSIALSKGMYESLFCDKDKIIYKLKKRMSCFIGYKEINEIRKSNMQYASMCNSNSKIEIEDVSCNDGTKICNNENILPIEEVYKSLSNDQDMTIRGLSECLKNYISHYEINTLLNLDLCEQEDSCDNSKISSMVLYVSKNMKDISNKLCKLLKSNPKCVQNQHSNCFGQINEELIQNKNNFNQKYPSNTDCDAGGNSETCENMDTCEHQFQIQKNNDDCCNQSNAKIYNQLSKTTQMQANILDKFQKDEISKCNLSTEIRKAKAKIRVNQFSNCGYFKF